MRSEIEAAPIRIPAVWQRMVSATIGAFVTSAFVTPLDVVKTRLQAPPSGLTVPLSTFGALRAVGECETACTLPFNHTKYAISMYFICALQCYLFLWWFLVWLYEHGDLCTQHERKASGRFGVVFDPLY